MIGMTKERVLACVGPPINIRVPIRAFHVAAMGLGNEPAIT
jgi:hypothetical protein